MFSQHHQVLERKQEFEDLPFYHGEISSATAHEVMRNAPDKSFILRYSTRKHAYTLTVKCLEIYTASKGYKELIIRNLEGLLSLKNGTYFQNPAIKEVLGIKDLNVDLQAFPCVPEEDPTDNFDKSRPRNYDYERTCQLLQYFYGEIDSAQAHRIMRKAPVCTYLLRYSMSKDSFYLTYKNSGGAFMEVPIRSFAELGTLRLFCILSELDPSYPQSTGISTFRPFISYAKQLKHEEWQKLYPQMEYEKQPSLSVFSQKQQCSA